MNYREKIRKAIECPQFGDATYGEWGALNLEQRRYIKRLLDELDSADNYLKRLYLENQKLQTEKEQINSLVNSCQEEIRRLKKQLESANEQISYLRRSIERKEERIIDLQYERIPYTNEYVAKLENQQKEFIDYMENKIYSIEPKGTGINYNCEYDSEEDFISAMEEQSRLNTLKEILSKYKEIIGGKDER